MAKKISNWINKYWYLGVATIIGFVLYYSATKMFFHQDDVDWFILANKSWRELLRTPIGDHVNYLWRILLKFEWDMFGLNFLPYTLVSMLMHIVVLRLIYVIALESSGRRDLAIAAVCLFALNTNWTETLLWISGQTIIITVIFVLMATHMIWRRTLRSMGLFLASLTSALAIGVLGASLIVYKKIRPKVIVIFIVLGILYKFMGGDGTRLELGMELVWKSIAVGWLMVVNTVIGRTLIPFDRFETFRIALMMILVGWLGWKNRVKIANDWGDEWSRFLMLQLVIYYGVVAIGRSQFGLGIMRAERYAYLGLAIVLLILARVLRGVRIKYLGLIVASLMFVQCVGFWQRAKVYIVRPSQVRTLFVSLEKVRSGECYHDAFLPYYVLQDQRLKYSDLIKLWGNNKVVIGEGEECMMWPQEK